MLIPEVPLPSDRPDRLHVVIDSAERIHAKTQLDDDHQEYDLKNRHGDALHAPDRKCCHERDASVRARGTSLC